MLSVSDLLNDFDFVQSFTVYRKTMTRQRGNIDSAETSLAFSGVALPATQIELNQIPEGDRQTGAMCFYTQQEIKITNTAGTSDEILWHGNRYRVHIVEPYVDYGFWKAIATKMDPSTEVVLS